MFAPTKAQCHTGCLLTFIVGGSNSKKLDVVSSSFSFDQF